MVKKLVMVWKKEVEGYLVCCYGYGIYYVSDFISIGYNEVLDFDLKVLDIIVLKFYGKFDVFVGVVSLEDGFMFFEVFCW